jgi:hypothetical protein
VRWLLLALLLSACGGAPPPPAPAAPTAAPSPASETAPAPFTAEQIHDAAREVASLDFKVEIPGKSAVRRVLRFDRVSDEGVDVASQTLDEGGAPIGEAKTEHAKWEELRKHGEFPRDKTKMHDESVTVPAGTFDCTVYEVTREGAVTTFYFAKKAPGPPVLYFTTKDGARVMVTTLLARTLRR